MIRKFLLLSCLLFLSYHGFSQKLYIAENGGTSIRRSNLDGTSLEPISSAGQVGAILDIVVDEQRNRVFWVQNDATNTIVKRADLIPNAGTVQLGNVVDFVRVAVANQFLGLAINKNARELYVTTSASGGSIYRFSLDATPTITVLPAPTVSSLFQSFGIDVDLVNSKIYFVNQATSRQIQIANLNGSSPSVIVNISGTYGTIHDVAVDPIGGKIYFSTNNTVGQIYSANLNGTSPLLLVNNLPTTIKGISLDTNNGFIYWATGSTAVGRAKLDGTGATNIVTGLSTVNYITPDFSTVAPPKIYWTQGTLQEIHRINPDGSDFERYYAGVDPNVNGLAINSSTGAVYWTDGNNTDIKTGIIAETNLQTTQTLVNLANGANGIGGAALDEGTNTLYFANTLSAVIQKINVTSPPLITPQTVFTPALPPFAVALDKVNGKLYYTTNFSIVFGPGTQTTARLCRVNLDGTGNEILIDRTTNTNPGPRYFFRDVKVDPVGGKVYWSVTDTNKPGFIHVADIANPVGTEAVLLPTSGEPRGIALDVFNNKIYWADRGSSAPVVAPAIRQANLDGSSPGLVHTISFAQLPNFIAIDSGPILPLAVINTTPGQSQNNVSRSANLTFTFDQSVFASSITSNNIIVTGEQTGIIQGTFTGGGTTTFTFNPTTDFKAGEVIRVVLTTGLLSTSGGTLQNDFSFQFTTNSAAAPETPPFFMEHVLSSTASGTFAVFPADIDGDGDMDAVGTAAGTNGVMWYENDGSQNFTERVIANTANGPTGVYAVDLDSDGDMDILVASQSDARVIWFDNDGNQNFTEKNVNATAGTPSNVYASDLDGDGDIDVMSTSYAPSVGSSANARLNYYFNDGNENFTQFNMVNFNATGAYPIDVDRDGDIDIVGVAEIATLSGVLVDKVAWFENDGNQNYLQRLVVATPPGRPYDTFATDMDGDGDVDILVAAALNYIGWYENDGSQNFTAHEIGSSESQPTEIYAADIDGDGDMDVISAHELLDEIALWINDGSQNFARQSVTTSADLVWDVYAADMDSDGDLDILSASRFGNEISWYENTLIPVCASAPTSNAGTDQFVCGGAPILLSGSVTNTTSSTWSTNGDGTFANATQAVTSYTPGTSDIANGTVQLSLTANDPDGAGPCVAVVSTITSTIDQPATVTVGNDISICANDPVLLNGTLGGSANNPLWTTTGSGSFSDDASLAAEYTPGASDISTGTVDITLTVDAAGVCPQVSDQLIVNINFCEIIVHNGISPNGDGLNDYFEIVNIQFIEPQNRVFIYNRWGDKVFEMANYNSTDPKKRFDGKSDDGKELPSGVYFYKITFASGSSELSGYLTLKR